MNIVDILHATQTKGPFGGYIKMMRRDKLSYHTLINYMVSWSYIKFVQFDNHILFIVRKLQWQELG